MASSNSYGAAGAGPQGNNAPGTSPRPTHALTNTQSTSASVTISEAAASKKRRNHRGGRRKKSRRQSFAVPNQEEESANPTSSTHDHAEPPTSSSARPPMYRLGQSGGRTLSSTSLDSQALLDHRDHPPMRTRRESRLGQNIYTNRANQSNNDLQSPYRPSYPSKSTSNSVHHHAPRSSHAHASSGGESEGENFAANDRTPLLAASHHDRDTSRQGSGYRLYNGHAGRHGRSSQNRRPSAATSSSSKQRRAMPSRQQSASATPQGHDVNNPPSVPGSPKLGPDMGYDDVMVTDPLHSQSPHDRRMTVEPKSHDQLIDIDDVDGPAHHGTSPSARNEAALDHRRHTIASGPEDDVCYPLEGMSEMADEDDLSRDQSNTGQGPRRRRYRKWPDLTVLDEWSQEERARSEGIGAKKISEPVLIAGRLRPLKHGWHRTEEDAPYRFTYFNEELPSTIHSQTLSELLQEGQSFQELFVPDPPELSSDESSDDEDIISRQGTYDRQPMSPGNQSKGHTRHPSLNGDPRELKTQSSDRSGVATPQQPIGPEPPDKSKRYGARPTFWLDVLSPTDTEMRVISKTFGIHPLTAEDIMMQEAREKVELFRHYYFVNYRTFEQDTSSENYLDPVNMYVVVFREGVISFHFSMTPHPANVRRRIRQLKDYLILSSDWISYAIIDDITDVFAPLIQSIEEEVDDIDDKILQLHSPSKPEPESERATNNEKASMNGEVATGESGGDMLRRVGEGRKKVMGLYRLLGNKADVIKGFAKRCNEHWEIAPRSEIGLYLGDIQDHILTMTGNLSHYETLLSRAHSNYLAQINIRMNERQEQTADVLGKLTVLGTIVLPMNIITGMWGMNVLVPGQEVDNLNWFWSITAGLIFFGVSCFFIAKRVYGIV
ncbi:MAG: hypothetical protein LQ337_000039 [Flavoplaca oasis]|nr:MAG: hypothetical protein LQ337_000039 [Flavoplaca oasis]